MHPSCFILHLENEHHDFHIPSCIAFSSNSGTCGHPGSKSSNMGMCFRVHRWRWPFEFLFYRFLLHFRLKNHDFFDLIPHDQLELLSMRMTLRILITNQEQKNMLLSPPHLLTYSFCLLMFQTPIWSHESLWISISYVSLCYVIKR